MAQDFRKILRHELFFDISSSGELVVKESDPSASLKKLTIKRIPAGAVAFELDHKPKGALATKLKHAFKQLSNLVLSSHDKANKSCDLIIVLRNEGKIKVVISDLKSHNFTKSDCEAQLTNSRIFFEYICALLQEYHGFTSEPEYRFVIFHATKPINSKAPTQQRNSRARNNQGGVTYVPLTLMGRNNSEAITSYPFFAT